MDDMQNTTLFAVLLMVSVASTTDTINQPDHYSNITGGNRLWNGLLHDCKVPTISCVQKNVYHYLDNTFGYAGDVSFGDFMHFKRNSVDYTKYTRKANTPPEDDNELEDDAPESPLEEVTKALHNKSVSFLMTHDMEVRLPEPLFEGSTLKISPKSLEEDGVIVKLDLIPKEIQENQAVGRILLKKIKQFFKNKLITAFMSIILVISLIKAKLMFFMPMVVGASTAKKILLKVLLFLFPALSHLFKLCSYYHDNYHKTKYHHHHHQIAHIHHLPSLHHNAPEVHFPPPDHGYKHEGDTSEFSGPGLGPEYISNRNAFDHMPSPNDENEIKSWGLGQAQGQKVRRGQQKPALAAVASASQIEQLALQAEKEVLLKSRLQQEQQRIRQENLKLQEQLKKELKLQEQLKLQALILAQQKTKLQPQLMHMQPPVQQHSPPYQMHPQSTTPRITYDAFYSPILEKIDKIFNSVGIIEEPCRERLVCSMYKNPAKFSPHSNLLSAELSRDSKDLQKPTSSNEAVVRFYRYVQAARDGQDQRECLRLYPACHINTEL